MIKKQAAKRKKKRVKRIGTYILEIVSILLAVFVYQNNKPDYSDSGVTAVFEVPQYSGQPYVEVNNNIPFFATEDLQIGSFEEYSELDSLGRCGAAYACLSKELMPTEERGKIGMVKPSGWQTVKYPEQIKDLYLYNRCHLIAWCLTGENANEKNLITGTRYMNVEGMLPFEEMTADYIDRTNHHVLYRVTPVFEGENLVASGVLMEAYSIEDKGEGIQFCVYCFNVQPGIEIDYLNGESYMVD